MILIKGPRELSQGVSGFLKVNFDIEKLFEKFKDQAVKELIALYTLEHCKEIESVKRYPRVRLCDTKNKNNVAPECQRYISKQHKHNSSNTNHLKSVAGRAGTCILFCNEHGCQV